MKRYEFAAFADAVRAHPRIVGQSADEIEWRTLEMWRATGFGMAEAMQAPTLTAAQKRPHSASYRPDLPLSEYANGETEWKRKTSKEERAVLAQRPLVVTVAQLSVGAKRTQRDSFEALQKRRNILDDRQAELNLVLVLPKEIETAA
jgi:hypothetical protein